MNVKKFDLGTVLSISTGILLGESIGCVYDILNFMSNDDLMTHQLPRVCDECEKYVVDCLKAQLPQLAKKEDVQKYLVDCKVPDDYMVAVEKMKSDFGVDEIEVFEIPEDDHEFLTWQEDLKRVAPHLDDDHILEVKLNDEISPFGDLPDNS